MKYLSKEEAKQISIEAANILSNKKLEDVVLLELGDEAVADYFVICTSSSYTQSQAAIAILSKEFKSESLLPYAHNENPTNNIWAIIDYGFLVVHVFTEEGREYYELEKLWNEAKKISI